MSLDDIHDIDDHSQITVTAMVARLRASRTEEQYIYRETELDEMWRIADMQLARRDLATGDRERLEAIRVAVVAAHDLVGIELKPVDAAEALETILPLLAPGA